MESQITEMIEVGDVICLAKFYKISEYALFYLAYIWWYDKEPNGSLEKDYMDFLLKGLIPCYVKQFIKENPLIDDSGSLLEIWIPILEMIKNSIVKEDRWLENV